MAVPLTLQYNPRLKDLPEAERPRERVKAYGPSVLSDAELLAVLLRIGRPGENVLRLAQGMLAHFGGLAGLARASFGELCQYGGVGEAKAAQVKAGLELGRRLLVCRPEELPSITSPADVAGLLMSDMEWLEQEQMRVLMLNTRNRVVGAPTVYVGSLHSSVVRVAELFREAIKQNCAAIIVVHNHPSGDPTPSPEDVKVTGQIVAAGRMLDIDVLDHLVIGRQRYVSLKERGLGFG
ncbi:MAG: DNA repair protein RadC [Chloroflexi bacterium]|nr:DNA repair protein RadC [Chloroflexota bacterium]